MNDNLWRVQVSLSSMVRRILCFVLAGMTRDKGRLRRFSGSPCEDTEKSVTKSVSDYS